MKKDNLGLKNIILKTKNPYIGPIICLGVIVLATIGLWIGNNVLENTISQLNDDINQHTSQVESLKSGSNLLQVSHLLNQNKAILKKLEKRSDVVAYIEHISDISRQYNIDMSGFEYSGDTIATTIVSRSQSGKPLAYKNVVTLLSDYTSSPSSLFDIGYISSISGHDNMKFALNFLIK